MTTPLPVPGSPGSPRSGRPAVPTALTALATVCCLLLVGCSGGTASGSDKDTAGRSGGPLKIALVTHGAKGDAFWELVRKGAEAAAAKDGVDLSYASDADAAAQVSLVRDAVRERVDGIALTLAKPAAMKAPVAEAKAAGIPVVGLNSGIDAWQSTGLLEYFGQDESVAGRAVGERLDQLGAKHALCVIHERGNIALEARCAGVKKTFTGETDILYVDGTDMDAMTAVVTARLQQEPDVDEVIANGAQFALAAVKAAGQAASKAKVATF
ncbi:substrate-binding domain-containing protein, partial [Streptomyces sp. NPDC002920]